jgi:hypothetical protein
VRIQDLIGKSIADIRLNEGEVEFVFREAGKRDIILQVEADTSPWPLDDPRLVVRLDGLAI